MENNKVSVGMTTYNSSRYVEEQLQSILNQTVLPDEIVISDDCSKDNTCEIIRKIINNNTKEVDIRLLVNQENIGFVKNFEQTFINCTGDIIFSCDADDIWKINKIETVLKEFEDEEVVYVYHDGEIIDGEGKVISNSLYKNYCYIEPIVDNKKFLKRCLEKKGVPFGMSIAFRSFIVSRIVPFSLGHDEWIASCATMYGKIGFIEEQLISYRRHNNNASGLPVMQESKLNSLISLIKKQNKEQWFNFSKYQLNAYKQFHELFSTRLDVDNLMSLLELIAYNELLVNISKSSKIKSIFYIFKMLFSGLFTKFRGNWKKFLIDIFYILIKG